MTETRAPYAAGETAQQRWSTTEIERLLAEATTGPWALVPFAEIGAFMDDPEKCCVIADCDLWGNSEPGNAKNAALIAAAPAIIRQLQEEKRVLREALQMSWTHHSTWSPYFPEQAEQVRKALAATQP